MLPVIEKYLTILIVCWFEYAVLATFNMVHVITSLKKLFFSYFCRWLSMHGHGQQYFIQRIQFLQRYVKQVWGISETRDQNYRSNARPCLRLADLLTEVVILQLHRGSERSKFDYWFIILADRSFFGCIRTKG